MHERDSRLSAAEAQRSRLMHVIEQSPAFICTLRGPDHVFEFANERYYQIVGRRDLIDKPVRDALPEVVGQGYIDILDRVYRTGEPFSGNEMPVSLRREGKTELDERFINVAWQALRDADGTIYGVFVHGVDVTDLIRSREAARTSEARLRTSEERLAFAVQAGDLGTFYCPMPMGRIEWNTKCNEHFWLNPGEEVDFDRFYAILHPDDRDATRQAVEHAIFHRQNYDVEYRTVSPTGQERWVRARGRAYYDAAGNPTRFDGVTLDITDRKLAEAERQALLDKERAARAVAERIELVLREGEQRFRRLANAMPQIVWSARPDGVLDYYNRRWFEYINVPETDAETATWDRYVHPEDLPRVAEQWRQSVETGRSYAVEFRVRGSDGAYCWFLVRAEAVRDEAGTIVRWHGTCTDIQTRKKTEERDRLLIALDDAVRHLDDPEQITATYARLLGEHLDVDRCAYADVEADEDTFNLTGDYNRGVPSIVGRYRFADFGQHVLGLMRADRAFVATDVDTHEPALEDLTAYRATLIRSVVCVPLHKQGRFVAAMAVHQRVPRKWATGEIDLVLRVAARCWESIERARVTRDREQLLQSEQAARAEAERAGRMKDEFLATLSHELRTPLNAVLGWSQIMRHSRDEADLAQGLEVIERNARAQSQIIEDLLDMSRIISGKVRLDVQRLDLAALVQAAADTARPTADAKGVDLTNVIDPLIGVAVSGDANRLQQVLWNLLTNAIKFTPKGGRVQVLLERVHSHLEISVSDTGEGIPPAFLPHVFDRFRQADATTTRRHGGLGLGLSIVKQLVELHGGTIRAASPGVGQGTTFTVRLPLVVLHRKAEPTLKRRSRATTARSSHPDSCEEVSGLRVLVIDDEPDARALIKRLLEDCDAIVTATGSVDEAVEQVGTGQFDVLCSDIGMPGEDGYSLIRRVRALGRDRGGAIPAIALTAYARPEDRVRVVRAGFQMHLPKPVEPMELLVMVASAAGRTGPTRNAKSRQGPL
ncbi:MAG TPA: PAS domain-containing protein [Tepidisphaeraceae bacterium]